MDYNTLGNLYELLGVHPKAPEQVIDAAYEARINLANAAKKPKKEKENLVDKLNEAKTILTDAKQRAEFDKLLREQQKGLIGNYRIIEQIGEGAFGKTYKAEHIILQELSCLKQNIDISSEDIELITKEAKLLWRIHHYSLPTLRDFFKLDDGSCVLAMTYVEGKDLFKIVEKNGGLDPEHVCWITQRLLNALHYLHFSGVIHCDVKPQNIIIKPEEHNAFLVDYGFAALNPHKKSSPEGYTPAFAPPELVADLPPLPESDLYSLGCSMIHALGGNPIGKTYPKGVPQEMQDFFDALVLRDPMQRPNWDKTDLIKNLSDIREKVFGRRSSRKELKV